MLLGWLRAVFRYALLEPVSDLRDALSFGGIGLDCGAICEKICESRPLVELQEQALDGLRCTAVIGSERKGVKPVFERLVGSLPTFVEVGTGEPRVTEDAKRAGLRGLRPK